VAQRFGTDEHTAWESAQNKTGDRWRKAFDDLLAVQPTTRDGAVALIDWFLHTERGGCMDQADAIALIESLRGFLSSAAAA